MGSEAEAEAEQNGIPRLPLFSIPPMQSPEHSGMLTPPLHTSVSVPFRWEEEPGKPRPCTALVPFTDPNDFLPKCLELPPRLLIEKLSSPITVLDGPYGGSRRFKSPSFRVSKDCYGSFSAERGQLGAMVLTKGGIKEKGWFGSWRRKAIMVKREVSGDSHVFPSSADRESDTGFGGESQSARVEMTEMKHSGSSSNLNHSKSRLWTTICEGLKQANPWKSKRVKKDEDISSCAM
ncbi:hypothetical protein L6164_021242 [Bauhinia variegata]|uniref:Uncharacterized protein n=1 Tax=Bauhinia variegata TaxID=167791 RepID=A0ACB9MXX1_BAUVA|nr:hypothetical protein L6164_021242 [Bauhinia variegata]